MNISKHLEQLQHKGDYDPVKKILQDRKEKLKREEERHRLEALPPLYVIYTVHGTFANKADWIKQDSDFCESLKSQLGYRVRIVPSPWSGSNSVKARYEGSNLLRDKLFKKYPVKDYPDAQHIIIAHSHGGNVAFMAVNSEPISERLLGVVTLATPFLSAERRWGRKLLDGCTGFFAGFLTGWSVLLYGHYIGTGWDLWPWAIGAAVLIVLLLFTGAWIIKKMENHANKICKMMPGSVLTPNKVAIIQQEGDEARAAIGGARLAGTLSSLVWKIATARIFELLNNILSFWDYGGYRGYRSMVGKLNNSIDMQYDFDNSSPPWIKFSSPTREIDKFLWRKLLGLGVLTVVLVMSIKLMLDGGPTEIFFAMLLIFLYGLPLALSIVMVLLGMPFAILSSISLIPIGLTVPLAGPYLNVSVEASLEGPWTVTQFKSNDENKSLNHSEAYHNPDVIKFISNWIIDKADTLRKLKNFSIEFPKIKNANI